MSTFITTGINVDVKKGKVFLSGYSSNVSPAKPSRFESTYLSEMLQTQGQEAVDAYLLEEFQGGMMRGGNNEYNQAMQLYGNATMENLVKLRQLKKESRGLKYVIQFMNGYYLKSMTTRRYFSTPIVENALQLNMVDAMIKAKKFSSKTEIICVDA